MCSRILGQSCRCSVFFNVFRFVFYNIAIHIPIRTGHQQPLQISICGKDIEKRKAVDSAHILLRCRIVHKSQLFQPDAHRLFGHRKENRKVCHNHFICCTVLLQDFPVFYLHCLPGHQDARRHRICLNLCQFLRAVPAAAVYIAPLHCRDMLRLHPHQHICPVRIPVVNLVSQRKVVVAHVPCHEHIGIQ